MGRRSWIIIGSVAVLWLLASITVPRSGPIRRGNVATAKTQIHSFASALERYQADVGTFPGQRQGLEALVHAPADLKRARAWRGTYLADSLRIPDDPWGNAYLYETGDGGRSCKVTSLGADGRPGGEDYEADISLSLPRP